jgi:Ni,Fe-hydrogenase III small subunit
MGRIVPRKTSAVAVRFHGQSGTAVTDIETFIDAAVWHGSLERADAMLEAHPRAAQDVLVVTGARDRRLTMV